MVLNAAVQMLREADELKLIITKFKSGTSMLQDRNLWATQQQLQKVYQKVLVLDLDYALDKKVEQDLWNIGFKQQIEALQAISKDRKNPRRSEGQAMLSWVLQAAAGFYLCLLHQICTTFQLDLPFRRRASMLGCVEGWGAVEGGRGSGPVPPPAAARYICQHCLVHLGDLARYRQQLRVAHTFYRHALVVSAHSGQPYNQLALVAWRRARRLGALYWHVRSLLVRAPFPPAPANLARTLRAAAASQGKELPVLPGVAPGREPAPAPAPAPAAPPARLDAHSYVTELIRALHFIHTVEELDTATSLVNSLNSSLTALVATDSFESMTLIKMACVLIWLVHSSTEELTVGPGALSAGEAAAAQLACALAAGALLALLLPAYTVPAPPQRALPALKVWLQWAVSHPQIMRTSAWSSRPALWPALANTLNMLAHDAAQLHAKKDSYVTVPLPEEEELHGFLPLEEAFKGLRFPNHATWDTYGGRVPDLDDEDDTDCDSPIEVSPTCLSKEPELEQRIRAQRLVRLGQQLAELRAEHFSFTEDNGVVTFTAASVGGEQLSLALAELSAARARGDGEGEGDHGEEEEEEEDGEGDSEEERAPPPPIVISEADFREKVREKRVGILKPQGSLERAREERAMASTQEEQEPECSEEAKGDDKKDARKPRVNIAMAAIMRKQEETNKQVKFVTPPPTPDSMVDISEAKEDKSKVLQPKAVKSLANLPIGRKTGGILSLKDKSAGYPHLVNTDPEPAKKNDKEEKKELKPNQAASSQSQQSYQPKRQEPPPPGWGADVPPQSFNEPPRMSFQKNYAGMSYNPTYQSNVNNQGIRLPVVNPKEIDVRTAALQKQSSRQELFQDGHKFGNHNYQMSGDKKNFLNDLPPRFANQYRYWQNAQENQFNDNKFRDDSFKPNTLFNSQEPRTSWMNTPQPPDSYQQPITWWKPENPAPFNYTAPPLNAQPNFYPLNANTSPYQNMQPFNQIQNNMGQNITENMNQPNYMQSAVGQPQQLQSLQSLVTSPNFSSSLNGYNYTTPVGYDASMYPQFNKGFPPVQMQKPPISYQGNKDLMDIGVGFASNTHDMQPRSLNVNYGEPMSELGMKNLEQIGSAERASGDPLPANTYSLFSGAPDAPAWGALQRHPHQVKGLQSLVTAVIGPVQERRIIFTEERQRQSLWSGPGPSPLERLLEQQKQMKQPPTPQ